MQLRTVSTDLGGPTQPLTRCLRLSGNSGVLWRDDDPFVAPARVPTRSGVHRSSLVGAPKRSGAQAGVEPAVTANAT